MVSLTHSDQSAWTNAMTPRWFWVLLRPASTSTAAWTCKWCAWPAGSPSALPHVARSTPWPLPALCSYLETRTSPWGLTTLSTPPWRITWPAWGWLWSLMSGINLCSWEARASSTLPTNRRPTQTPCATACCLQLSFTWWLCLFRRRGTPVRFLVNYLLSIRQLWMGSRRGYRTGRGLWWRPGWTSESHMRPITFVCIKGGLLPHNPARHSNQWKVTNSHLKNQ